MKDSFQEYIEQDEVYRALKNLTENRGLKMKRDFQVLDLNKCEELKLKEILNKRL